MTDVHSDLAHCRMPEWYPDLAPDSFPTVFVRLSEEEIRSLAAGETEGAAPSAAISRLAQAMRAFSGRRFVSVDLAAPTDTERFERKRGAVSSAGSAWRVLASSAKIRRSASEGLVQCVCVRPFRRMDQTREFRLFIRDGALKAMSQYWLVRHFRRLEGRKEGYWSLAKDFVSRLSWRLPLRDLAMDVYVTSKGEMIVIDLNPWGAPTDPLMLRSWEQDWTQELGIRLIPPPHQISGDVNVSF